MAIEFEFVNVPEAVPDTLGVIQLPHDPLEVAEHGAHHAHDVADEGYNEVSGDTQVAHDHGGTHDHRGAHENHGGAHDDRPGCRVDAAVDGFVSAALGIRKHLIAKVMNVLTQVDALQEAERISTRLSQIPQATKEACASPNIWLHLQLRFLSFTSNE